MLFNNNYIYKPIFSDKDLTKSSLKFNNIIISAAYDWIRTHEYIISNRKMGIDEISKYVYIIYSKTQKLISKTTTIISISELFKIVENICREFFFFDPPPCNSNSIKNLTKNNKRIKYPENFEMKSLILNLFVFKVLKVKIAVFKLITKIITQFFINRRLRKIYNIINNELMKENNLGDMKEDGGPIYNCMVNKDVYGLLKKYYLPPQSFDYKKFQGEFYNLKKIFMIGTGINSYKQKLIIYQDSFTIGFSVHDIIFKKLKDLNEDYFINKINFIAKKVNNCIIRNINDMSIEKGILDTLRELLEEDNIIYRIESRPILLHDRNRHIDKKIADSNLLEKYLIIHCLEGGALVIINYHTSELGFLNEKVLQYTLKYLLDSIIVIIELLIDRIYSLLIYNIIPQNKTVIKLIKRGKFASLSFGNYKKTLNSLFDTLCQGDYTDKISIISNHARNKKELKDSLDLIFYMFFVALSIGILENKIDKKKK